MAPVPSVGFRIGALVIIAVHESGFKPASKGGFIKPFALRVAVDYSADWDAGSFPNSAMAC